MYLREGSTSDDRPQTTDSPRRRVALSPRRSSVTAIAALLAVTTLVHLLLALRFPLAPDETYYWEWSRHPAAGYYDQGPLIAWWIHASCLLFGSTEIGVRAGILLAALATQLFLYLFARDLFGPRVALLASVFTAITPLALAGSFIATYDPLVVLFWTAAMYFACRALFFDSRSAWIGLGIALGLGLLSKHTMILFVPCLLLYLLTAPNGRAWLRRREPYAACAIALLVFAPNLVWQTRHDWMTFRHLFLLTDKGTDNPFLRRLGDFAGSQAGLLTPLLFFGMIAALCWAYRRRNNPNRGPWFLFCLSAPILITFLLMTAKSKVQANWAICGWLAPPVAYAAWLETKPGRSPARIYAWAAVAFCLFLSFILSWPESRVLMGIHTPGRWDQMNKLYGGPELGAAADRERARMEEESPRRLAMGAATYDIASRLAFYMRGQPQTYCFFLGTRLNSYALWNRESYPRPGDNALIAEDRPPDDPELPRYGDIFARVEPVPESIPIYRRGLYAEPVRVYYLYRCYGYHPNPTVERAQGG